MAKALMRKQLDDEVFVNRPKSDMWFIMVDVSVAQ